MKLIQSFLTQNDCYKLNKPIIVKGLMLHSVGCSQSSASTFIKQWNKSGVEKAVHGFIEPNGNVYQTLPFNIKGWHGASGKLGSVNVTHLGFEMCEPSTIRYTGVGAEWTDSNPTETKNFVLATYNTAVELFAYLCKEFKLNPLEDGVIISHHEGFLRGIASGHADVEHIWSKFNLTMDKFRQDVNKAMNGVDSEIMVDKSYIAKKIITATTLNVRTKPDVNSQDIGDLAKNTVVTITGEINGWYRISYNNKDAYISASYTKDYTEPVQPDYKSEFEKLKVVNEGLINKINNAIKTLQ